ncbi:hypothetical protein NESM_000027900 [Novymonas esmeraldas]|uniref:Uncharacterized protein n=1 Tax=Novymonas esmeraldas TaxID=1808958 RepID=A0AAW0F146_9TRYP
MPRHPFRSGDGAARLSMEPQQRGYGAPRKPQFSLQNLSTGAVRRSPPPATASARLPKKATASPAVVMAAGAASAPPRDASVAPFSAGPPPPPTYTGAALLAGYTSRRKVMQKAATLSSRMRHQVQDVVQIEEEQRLLSQAYRGRQKLVEQQEQTPQQQAKRRSVGATEKTATSTNLEGAAGGSSATVADFAAAAGSSLTSGVAVSMAAEADAGIGMVLDGAFDIKRYLEQQAQDKNDTLVKMRGLQQAILELSEEAAADEERHMAQLRYEASATAADAPYTARPLGLGDGEDSGGGGGGGVLQEDGAERRPAASVEVGSKMEAIRDMRATLKEMLDVHHAPFVAGYSMGGSSAARRAVASTVPGSTWLDQDATYRPPAPPQIFSTNAFAVTMEYLSNSVACVTRVADEVCVATTFRSRTDRVLLQPHLDSLQKWMSQAERCMDATQRHLRHFQAGEVAVLEGGAYELNSLREQTLLLKESLTAQEQKVKATEEAKVSLLHRLREISRRCHLWETHLLHRSDGADLDAAAAPIWGSAEVTGNVAGLGYFATPTTTTPGHAFLPDEAEGCTSASFPSGTSRSVSLTHAATAAPFASDPFRPPHRTTLDGESTSEESPPLPSMMPQTLLLGSAHSGGGSSDAESRPVSSSTVLRPPSQPLVSEYARAHEPPTALSLQLMEERVSRSWCNPYVRKQRLRQRAEQLVVQQQRQLRLQQQQQLQGQDRVGDQRFSVARMSTSRGADHENDYENLTAESARAPTSHPAFDFVRGLPSISAETDTSAAEAGRSRRSLARLGPHAEGGHHVSPAEARHRASRIGELAAAMTAATTTAPEEPVTDVADVRSLQLLQSLLRSMPSTSRTVRHDSLHVKESTDRTASPSLGHTVRIDVSQDEERRAATRQSMQRLIRYLTTCTTRLTAPRFSTLQKP